MTDVNKKKVCVFTLYGKDGASSNFRILMYLADLEKVFSVRAYSFWNGKYTGKYIYHKKKYIAQIALQYAANVCRRIWQILFIAPKSDVVIFQKGVIPALPLTFTRYLRRRGCKIIFDVDDAVYLTKRDRSDRIAKDADTVCAGNETLLRHYRELNRHTVLLPTVDYSPGYRGYLRDTFADKRVGWIGSGATIDNLELVTEALNRVVRRHPEVTVQYICDAPYGFQEKISGAVFTKWTPEGFRREMSGFTVGIMPLKDTPYNRGKCGFKLIQYLNLHKPVIASPVGVNGEIVGHCGAVAETAEQWETALESLLFDREAYDACVARMPEEFDARYGYGEALKRWISLINE